MGKEIADLKKQLCLQPECLTREILDAFVDCIYVYRDKSIYIKWAFDEPEMMEEVMSG